MIKTYILLILLLVAPLVGCGGSRPSPEEVIAGAIDAINEVETYRFEMTVTVTQDGETNYGNMQGEHASPDRLHVIMTSDGDTQESIIIGENIYHRGFGSNSWEVGQSLAETAWATGLTRFLASTVEMLDTLVGVVELRDEKIDGVTCFHYRGSVDIEAQLEEQIANLDPTSPVYEDMLRYIEQQRQWQQVIEFWIGKKDHLLRQVDMQYEMVYTEDTGEDNEREERITATYTLRFFDFNQPIQIEPPIVDTTGGVNLLVTSTGSGAGCEDQHCQVDFDITITNQGLATARNVRVFIDSSATNQGLQTMEALPDEGPVDLSPDESTKFLASWECNLNGFSDEEFHQLVQQYVIWATWTDEVGQQHEKLLRETDETGAIIE